MRVLNIIILFLSLFFVPFVAFPGMYKGCKVVDNVVIVKLRPATMLKSASIVKPESNYSQILSEIEVQSVTQMFPYASKQNCLNCVDLTHIYRITYSKPISMEKLVLRLDKLPEVEYCQPEFYHESFYAPNDPKINLQYHHELIQTFTTWDHFKSDTNIVIGVVDSGFDIDHDDLISEIAYNYNDPINGIDDDNDGYIDNFRGWDFGENDNNPEVSRGDHGTWVAGVAVATVDNEIGIAGVANGAKFLPIKTASAGGSLRYTWESIVYAANHGCQIINCSWGGNYKEPLGNDIINYATFNKGALVVAAAGNNSTQEEFYPASFRNCLSVAGTVSNNQKWSVDNSQASRGSSWGYYVDLSAPAAGYHSTADGNGYTFMYGGTSFASPMVAGVAALVKTNFPDLSPIALGEQLKAYTYNIDTIPYNLPYHDMLGTGRLDALPSATEFTKPGIRYTSYSIDQKPPYLPGDTLTVDLELANYLASAKDISISIEFNTQLIEVLQSEFVIDSFPANDTLKNSEMHFSFVFSDELPLDFEAIGKFVYKTDTYRSYEYFRLQTNPSTMDLNSLLESTITANGRLGYPYSSQEYGNGFSYLDNKDLLFEGGLILAEASNKVASSFLNEQDFIVQKQVQLLENDTADFHFQSKYRAEYLEIDVIQNVYAWNDKPLLCIDYELVNTSDVEKPNVRVGNFWDWEILNPWYNTVEYNEETGVSYTYSSDPESIFVGTAIVDDNETNFYAIDNVGGGDGTVDLYFDDSDIVRYYCMTSERHNSKDGILGTDVALFHTSSPQYIAVDDTVTVRSVIALGNSKADIEELMSEVKTPQTDTVSDTVTSQLPLFLSENKKDVIVYPTFTDGIVTIENVAKNATLKVYTVDGVCVYSTSVQSNSKRLDLTFLSEGFYTIQLLDKSISESMPIFIE